MKRLFLLLSLVTIPAALHSQFTVEELKSYLERSASEDSLIIVDTWDDEYYRGTFVDVRNDTLLFRNTITETRIRIALPEIEYVRNEIGEYFFDGLMYREALNPGTRSDTMWTADHESETVSDEFEEEPATRTIVRMSHQNVWKRNNPDGEVGVPYLILGSGGHYRSTLFVPRGGNESDYSPEIAINPTFNAGLLLPTSSTTTLQLMYKYDYRSLDNILEGFTTKSSDHFIYLQMKIRLGK